MNSQKCFIDAPTLPLDFHEVYFIFSKLGFCYVLLFSAREPARILIQSICSYWMKKQPEKHPEWLPRDAIETLRSLVGKSRVRIPLMRQPSVAGSRWSEIWPGKDGILFHSPPSCQSQWRDTSQLWASGSACTVCVSRQIALSSKHAMLLCDGFLEKIF